jgi:NAD(P)-dependent dehydrogenase (short-subunit alcohol dehydrogenase family)
MQPGSALITGAATGIGMALARRLDAEGWRVFAGYRSTPPDALLAGASPRLEAVRLDVSDPEEIARAAAALEQELGDAGLSLLVSNAATTDAHGPVEFIDVDAFRHLMDVNFWGPLRLAQACLPLLRRSGRARIVIVSSSSVYLTIPLGCAYPVSKVALAALARHLRMELAPFGIEVTDLQPGGVRTAMTEFPEAEEQALWAAIPPELRADYAERFQHPGSPLEGGFEYESPEAFAERIHLRILGARRLAPVYVLGKGVGFLPLLQRLLPVRGVEAVWRRFFRVGKGAGSQGPS